MNNKDAARVLRIMASGIELKGYKTKWVEGFREAYEIAIKGLEKRPQADEGAIEILTNYEKTICNNCLLRPCGVPCRLLTALRYAIKYMKGDIE